jgi:hypothetical protein
LVKPDSSACAAVVPPNPNIATITAAPNDLLYMLVSFDLD